MARITKKKFREACKGSGGVQTIVAKALGIIRQSVSAYLKKHPEMRKYLDAEGDKIIDVAENNIDRDIVSGDIDSSKWALLNRKRGKERGYGPKQEVEHSGESHATFNLIEKSVEEIKRDKLNNKPKAGGDAKSSK